MRDPNRTTEDAARRPHSASGEGPELVAEEVERHRHRHRDRLRGQVADRARADQDLPHGEVEAERGDADGEEARRLEAGGADIIQEMYEAGELGEALDLEQPEAVAATPAAPANDLPAQSPPLQIE